MEPLQHPTLSKLNREDRRKLERINKKMLTKGNKMNMQQQPKLDPLQEKTYQLLQIDQAIKQNQFNHAQNFSGIAVQVAIELFKNNDSDLSNNDIIEEAIKFTEAVRERSLAYAEELKIKAPIPQELVKQQTQLLSEVKALSEEQASQES